ncbi:MAG TPA: hypothetical protein PLH01_07215, partial [Kiritimatiellia bacterium]|nr:hypothetical protein [Kiritimatiellia bacterium]
MTGGVRCGGGIGIALALSVTMGWGAPQTSLTAGRMRVAATADRISVSLEGVERFAFPARVAVDTEEGGADRDLFEPAFRQEAGRCVWTSRTTNWEKKEVTLSVEGGAAVLRVTVQGKGKLGKLRFFPQTDRTGPLAYEVSRYLLPVALGGSRCVPQWRNTMES